MPTGVLSIGQCATLTCLLEATAPKPGNVHRGADFEDLKFTDFVASAVAIGPAMEAAHQTGVGAAVLAAIRATRKVVSTNTNLGMVLLIAPLAAVPPDRDLREGISAVLRDLGPDDARDVYQAIREVQPGGLGKVAEMDVAASPPDDLLAAMRAAAPRDLVARQYAENFTTVLNQVVPWLIEGLEMGWTLTETIVHTHVRLMSEHPDSLIARKCGVEIVQQAAARAGRVLECTPHAPREVDKRNSPRSHDSNDLAASEDLTRSVKSTLAGGEAYHEALADLDFWLRSDGHRRNPGTTADLIAAGLFAGLREGVIQPPYR